MISQNLKIAVWLSLLLACSGRFASAEQAPASATESRFERPATARPGTVRVNQPAALDEKRPVLNPETAAAAKSLLPSMSPQELIGSGRTVILFGLISLVPVAVLMLTAFVRINIVLILLRQALGSPQVPGNQVLTALALLLTALVMRPTGETIYRTAVAPYLAGEIKDPAVAWVAGSGPIKSFMVHEIWKANHGHYVQTLLEYDNHGSAAVEPVSFETASSIPLRVIAPAFLLSELTEALLIGFYLYLPFLVVDLVVAAVLAASGLFMLPPSLIATPVKLLLFVLADGWFEVAKMILAGYGVAATSP